MVANLLSPTCSKKGNLDFHTRSLQRSISEKALKDFDNLTYKTCQRHPAIPQSVTLRKLPTLNQPGIDRRTHIETGGPDLSDLRGYANMPSRKTSERKSERNTTVYDKIFEVLLMNHGYLAHWNSGILPKPDNWKELKDMLARDLVDCTKQDYEDFVTKADAALGEAKIITGLFPLILGNDQILHEQDIIFANLDPLVPGIADAEPDLFDGASAIQLKHHIQQSSDRLIVPSKQGGIPILSIFSIEAKGPDGVIRSLGDK